MLGRENRQNNFLDSWTYERMLPKEDPLLEIKEKIDFSFVEEETKDLYSSAMGRVSFPPVIIFKMLFLEYYANLSDRGVSKAVKRDVLFRYFVGLSIEDEVPDDTTLVKFRSRLGEERFRELFDRIVKQAQRKGLLKERIKIVDATHITADIAIQGLVNLLRQGRRMAVRKIEKATNKRPQELEEKYITKEKIYKKPTNEEIEKEINLTKEFISQIEGKYTEEVEEITDLLKEVVSQKESEKLKNKDISTPPKKKRGRPRKVNIFEKSRKPDPQRPSDNKHLTGQAKRSDLTKRKDQIPSFVDPDARFGHKSKKKTFCGYKAHAAMDESGIVTSVQTFGGNENESIKLKELLEEEKRKAISSEATTADGLYDPANARQAIKDNRMQAFIPSPNNERQIDEGFSYCPETDKAICPEGKVSKGKTRQSEGDLHYFSTRDCKSCTNKECLKKNMKRVRVYVSDAYKLRQGVDEEKKREALLIRKRIEAKFGEAKKWHNLDRARYRGRWKVAIQVLMTFLVTNCKRIIKLLKERWEEFLRQLKEWEERLKEKGNLEEVKAKQEEKENQI